MTQQTTSSRPDLVIRTIPFDLATALRRNGAFDLHWFDDKGISYLAIGYSFALEYAERFINLADTVLPRFIKDEALRRREGAFNRQEANHAKYHRVLNDLTGSGSPTAEQYNPRVYDFFYADYKTFREPLMKRLFEPKNQHELFAAVNETIFRRAAFETVTCLTGLTYFDYFFDAGRLSQTLSATRTPAVLYLFGYHLAEELEHCATAFEVYDEIFHEPVWTAQSLELAFGNPARSIEREVESAAFFAARRRGDDLSLSDLHDNEFAAKQRETQASTLAPGFHPAHGAVAEQKDYFIAKWEREWEPLLREKVLAQIS
ncbi:MAG: hypothetical protein C3F11_14140 [Methylocystaceae bacterium]|nr:MAG: hypothetical protein C3F11_14140 [Methylocystaceae bacterium]